MFCSDNEVSHTKHKTDCTVFEKISKSRAVMCKTLKDKTAGIFNENYVLLQKENSVFLIVFSDQDLDAGSEEILGSTFFKVTAPVETNTRF